MNLLGIHPDFWAVLGDKNPLIECDFCELSYLKKVWLIKGLCDHVTVSLMIYKHTHTYTYIHIYIHTVKPPLMDTSH